MLNIVFMGTPDYAAAALKSLIGSEHQVSAVITQPDRRKGRGRELAFTPVKEVALAADIPVMQPANVNTKEALAEISSYRPDIIVVAAFGQILKKPLLDLPPLGCINIHASLLPRLRGAAPIQQAILTGESATGVTIMKMDVGLDTGDMICKSVVDITPGDTGESLHDKLAAAGGELITHALSQIEAGTAAYEKQDDSKSTYAGMLKKEMGHISWEQTAIYNERLVRAFYPWPGAYTSIGNKRIKVVRASLGEGSGTPGTVLAVSKDFVEVACGEGSIRLLEVIPEGKKQIDIKAFLNGYSVKEGDVFIE